MLSISKPQGAHWSHNLATPITVQDLYNRHTQEASK